jgi:hypothetical protein
LAKSQKLFQEGTLGNLSFEILIMLDGLSQNFSSLGLKKHVEFLTRGIPQKKMIFSARNQFFPSTIPYMMKVKIADFHFLSLDNFLWTSINIPNMI